MRPCERTLIALTTRGRTDIDVDVGGILRTRSGYRNGDPSRGGRATCLGGMCRCGVGRAVIDCDELGSVWKASRVGASHGWYSRCRSESCNRIQRHTARCVGCGDAVRPKYMLRTVGTNLNRGSTAGYWLRRFRDNATHRAWQSGHQREYGC